MTGQTVAHYRLVAKISEGAGAVVYHAHDLALGREVVLKLVAPGALDGVARFQHEARAISSLNHPNICTIYEIGEHDGWHFLAMELLDGEVLARDISRGPLATERLIDIAIQIADALDAAHEADRSSDLKPANIFVTRSGRVKLLDFGVALLPRRGPSQPRWRITTSPQARFLTCRRSRRRPKPGPSKRPVLAQDRALRDGHRPPAVRRPTAPKPSRDRDQRAARAGTINRMFQPIWANYRKGPRRNPRFVETASDVRPICSG